MVVVLVALAAGATAWRLADVKPDPNAQAIADGCQRDTTRDLHGLRAQLGLRQRSRFPVERAASRAALGDGNGRIA